MIKLCIVPWVVVDVLVLQHAEKVRSSGDPGLTDLGRAQAAHAAGWLKRTQRVSAVWSSPLRRARETAEPLAAAFSHPIRTDRRLSERMNWDDEDVLSLEEFLAEWQSASADRLYHPRVGDSSTEASDRFIEAIFDITTSAPNLSCIVVVAHGGVTVDALRTLIGDDVLDEQAPELISNGVPCCAITRLRVQRRDLTVAALPSTSHMADTTRRRPA